MIDFGEGAGSPGAPGPASCSTARGMAEAREPRRPLATFAAWVVRLSPTRRKAALPSAIVWHLLAAAWVPAAAQPLSGQRDVGLAAVALQLRQLDGVKRVLMIGAHPDDEDTALLATLARGMGAETAYLSLTRGEGGQNFIGPRLREGLGVIRTGELVAARALDGGEQFFTRAYDFGYSKTLDEALEFWPLDEVLRDVVFVVRTFRPHVVVSVFSGTPRDGHGHHQFAGVVARAAFEASGNPERFAELAARAGAWTPLKLYRLVRRSPEEATLALPTGHLDPVLGRSPFQLAMESRSRHRSQEMGAPQLMGPRASGLRLEASRVGTAGDDGIFAGVDTTLAGQLGDPAPTGWPADADDRIAEYRRMLAAARKGLSAADTEGATVALAEGARTLQELLDRAPAGADTRVLKRRLAQISEAVLAAAGVVVEARVDREFLVPGESALVDVIVWNGGVAPVAGARPELVLPSGWSRSRVEADSGVPAGRFSMSVIAIPADGEVPPGQVARRRWRVTVPPDAPPSSPYYLDGDRTGDLYAWPDDGELWARPFRPSPVRASMALEVAGGELALERSGYYVGLDRTVGEYRKRPLVAPAVNVAVDPPWMVWPEGAVGTRTVGVALSNFSGVPRGGTLRLMAPEGWSVEPASWPFGLEPNGAASFSFAVRPDGAPVEGAHVFRAVAREEDPGSATACVKNDGLSVETCEDADIITREKITREYVTTSDIVDHPHIPRAAIAREAAARVSVVPVVADPTVRVGYIMGSGDDGAEVLRQIGMRVEELGAIAVRSEDFAGYDAIVLGIRAYETRPELAAANRALLDFASRGGTVVVQYNKYDFATGGFAPYPLSMRRPHDRVTDEEAPVAVIAPESPLFNTPNAIGPGDFEGWVQERGLYLASEWDARYETVMEMADPGEDPKRGALLVAPVGDGLYVYTGIAFFRQLPAGVPGAIRLFANLVSLGGAESGGLSARRR